MLTARCELKIPLNCTGHAGIQKLFNDLEYLFHRNHPLCINEEQTRNWKGNELPIERQKS